MLRYYQKHLLPHFIAQLPDEQPPNINIFDHLQAGLVRFIGNDRTSPTVWMNRSDGTIEIEYSPSTTATALIGQLRSFGLKDIDQDFIVQIAGRNGNTTFEGTEIEELDQYLEQVASRDKPTVMRAVQIDGTALRYADSTLKKDKQVVMAALQSNRGPAFCYAEDSLKSDRDFVLDAVKISPSILEDIAEPLKKDREIVMAAVANYGYALQYADDSLKKDEDVVLAAVRRHSLALEYADESLRRERHIVKAAIKRDGAAFKFADPSLQSDRSFALGVIYDNPSTIQHVDKSLREDMAFVSEAIDWNVGCYRFLSPEVIEKLPKEQKERIATLQKLSIEFPERFVGRPPYVLDTVIANRQGAAPKPSQPVAIVVYPKRDWNNAFRNNQIKQLIDRGYHVMYFEAGSDEEVYSSLQAATAATGRKAQLFVLGGHGTREHTSMGEGDPATTDIGNESAYVDLSDEREMLDRKLSSSLTDDSVVILESCSTGEGREGSSNVANMMKRVFPQSRVFAPISPTGVVEYKYDDGNKVIGAEYIGGTPITYSIER